MKTCYFYFPDSIHKAVNETQQINLHCRPPVEDEVIWSVERNGYKLDILTVNADRMKKLNKQSHKMYDGLADKSLTIVKAEISDSGKYFCNNKAAVDLTVIPKGNIKLELFSFVVSFKLTKIKSNKNLRGSVRAQHTCQNLPSL